ncbi:MAG TPA: glycerol-3-phosphate 1-O-acyltransferase [Anaerolineae bacterium]|nr:glycerol-3-phosphate 1-O-acyltransferase [Anaerolineae bacterium]
MFALWIGVLVAGYLLGSIPGGFLIVRWLRGIDVRQVGSGRIGGTNVLRAAGWKVALVVMALDAAKGALAVLLARWVGAPPLVEALAGALAITGHNYSVFLGFRGGAGAMTAIGAALALWPWSALIMAAVGLTVALTTKYSSLGSTFVGLLALIIFVVRGALGLSPWAYAVYGLLALALIAWALRPNYRRLARGEERRVNLKAGQKQ